MPLFELPKDTIDASHGDPLFSCQGIWQLAVEQSAHQLRQYNQNTINSRLSRRYREALVPIHDYFHDRGFQRKGWTGVGLDCFMMLDGGTTRAFDMVMRVLVDDVAKWNEKIQQQNKQMNQNVAPIRPVILMPTPTYGHFLRHIEQSDCFVGKIECVALPRRAEDNWAVNTDTLKTTLKELTLQGKRVVAYFDSNPNNPTGYVRGKDETVKIGEILTRMSDYYQAAEHQSLKDESRNRDLFEDLSSLDDMRYLPRHRSVWNGPTSRIQLIDDMVYDGLQYKDSPTPCSFSEALPNSKDWITITGPSKNGFAALRAGLVIADDDIIRLLRDVDTNSGYCTSEMTMSLLSSFFNNEAAPKSMRGQYQRKATQYYEFAGLFLKAMINGADSMRDELTPHQLRKMRTHVKEATNLPAKDVTKLLYSGIDGLQITTSPQAGFFHLLDASDLKGRSYRNDRSRFYKEHIVLKDEADIEDLRLRHHLHLASGNYMGADISECLQRVTFAMPPQKLVDTALRLGKITSVCKPAPS